MVLFNFNWCFRNFVCYKGHLFIQMPMRETDRNPILVDTKIWAWNTLLAESQKRNARCVHLDGFFFFDVIAIKDLFFNESRSVYVADFLISTCLLLHRNDNLCVCLRNTRIIALYKMSSSLYHFFCNNLFRCFKAYISFKEISHCSEQKNLHTIMICSRANLKFVLNSGRVSERPVSLHWKCCYCQFEFVCPAILKPEITPIPSQANSDKTPS